MMLTSQVADSSELSNKEESSICMMVCIIYGFPKMYTIIALVEY